MRGRQIIRFQTTVVFLLFCLHSGFSVERYRNKDQRRRAFFKASQIYVLLWYTYIGIFKLAEQAALGPTFTPNPKCILHGPRAHPVPGPGRRTRYSFALPGSKFLRVFVNRTIVGGRSSAARQLLTIERPKPSLGWLTAAGRRHWSHFHPRLSPCLVNYRHKHAKASKPARSSSRIVADLAPEGVQRRECIGDSESGALASLLGRTYVRLFICFIVGGSSSSHYLTPRVEKTVCYG